MTCRALIRPAQQAPSARERLEQINERAAALFDRLVTGSPAAELQRRALEIQHIACIGAAYERRREREDQP